jgi:SAM-dependent methyltransferase
MGNPGWKGGGGEMTEAELDRTKAEESAARFRVPASIHAEDLLFRFFQSMHGPAAVENYFSSGYGNAQMIGATVRELLPTAVRPDVLEFAAGFGRISRHMRHVQPPMDVTVCDIHPAAVEFARSVLGMPAIVSAARHDDFVVDREYDLIFALSFFSHLPDSLFASWIAKLFSALKPGGFLPFSTHGETSMRIYPSLAQYYDPATGHGFDSTVPSDQADIQGENYGTAVSDFLYVARQIRKTPAAQILRFTAGRWWGHQDEWILAKAS